MNVYGRQDLGTQHQGRSIPACAHTHNVDFRRGVRQHRRQFDANRAVANTGSRTGPATRAGTSTGPRAGACARADAGTAACAVTSAVTSAANRTDHRESHGALLGAEVYAAGGPPHGQRARRGV